MVSHLTGSAVLVALITLRLFGQFHCSCTGLLLHGCSDLIVICETVIDWLVIWFQLIWMISQIDLMIDVSINQLMCWLINGSVNLIIWSNHWWFVAGISRRGISGQREAALGAWGRGRHPGRECGAVRMPGRLRGTVLWIVCAGISAESARQQSAVSVYSMQL